MTDREMLELAAKAAGIRTPSPDDMDPGGRQYEESLGLWCKFKWGWNWWNPREDDGDALRLAVQLMIRVSVNRAFPLGIPGSVTVEYPDRDCFYFALGEAVTNGDPYAATRRAIVRAAAEIGRQMEEAK